MKAVLSTLALMASVSLAQSQSYVSNLTPDQDGGGARQGSGTVSLTLTGTTLSLTGTYTGLSTGATAGHIHGPAAAGANAGVIYDLAGVGVMTKGSTSGTYGGTVELIPLKSGTYTVAQQLADLNNGLWYLNIHDTTFGGGEIRGQILPVPEPSTLALGALGVASLLAWRSRHVA